MGTQISEPGYRRSMGIQTAIHSYNLSILKTSCSFFDIYSQILFYSATVRPMGSNHYQVFALFLIDLQALIVS